MKDFRNLFEVLFFNFFMKLGVLFSGGKDSCYALHEASKEHEIVCLLSVVSKNFESYMFHVPNIELTNLQAESMKIPLMSKITEGEKEKELNDLKTLIIEAKEEYGIEGIVTGAVESVYQATRIQKICDELDLWCFNPLWQKDQIELLKDLLENGFEILVTGVFGYPLDENWLGKKIDENVIEELEKFSEKYKIKPAGEGGEIETTVVNAPMFRKKIIVEDYEKKYSNYSGIFKIDEARLG